MPRADRLTVIYHDDSTEQFEDVRYSPRVNGVRIFTAGGEQVRTEVLMVLAELDRKPTA